MVKTIVVSDEVYDILKKFKLLGESFSDTIKRLLKRGNKLTDIIGTRTITKEDWAFVQRRYNQLSTLTFQKKRRLLEKMKKE
ncbi:MAG: antitoxin VapB family protein [Candidatus Odinarchaeota archaeon]|nr:antitoxin VapB family protein [Candidatus Odinarchaeota archaeon]